MCSFRTCRSEPSVDISKGDPRFCITMGFSVKDQFESSSALCCYNLKYIPITITIIAGHIFSMYCNKSFTTSYFFWFASP